MLVPSLSHDIASWNREDTCEKLKFTQSNGQNKFFKIGSSNLSNDMWVQGAFGNKPMLTQTHGEYEMYLLTQMDIKSPPPILCYHAHLRIIEV